MWTISLNNRKQKLTLYFEQIGFAEFSKHEVSKRRNTSSLNLLGLNVWKPNNEIFLKCCSSCLKLVMLVEDFIASVNKQVQAWKNIFQPSALVFTCKHDYSIPCHLSIPSVISPSYFSLYYFFITANVNDILLTHTWQT